MTTATPHSRVDRAAHSLRALDQIIELPQLSLRKRQRRRGAKFNAWCHGANTIVHVRRMQRLRAGEREADQKLGEFIIVAEQEPNHFVRLARRDRMRDGRL